MTAREAAQIIDRILYPEPWESLELSDKAREALETAVEVLENQDVQDTGQISEGW